MEWSDMGSKTLIAIGKTMATIAKVLCILVLLFVSAFAAKIASNEPTNNNRPDEVDESEDDSSEISVDELKTTEHAAANQPHEVDHEKSEDDSFDFSVDDLKITERAAKGPRHHKAGRSKNKRGGKHKNKKGGRRKRGGRKKKVRGKPAEPWKSAEAVPRAEQWKPAEAVQPAKPEEPWKPTEAVQPVQPAEPWKPTEPVQPVKPEEPWKPAEPVQAAVPGAFIGKWELVSNNSGVSAMHAQLFPKTNQVLMYDATLWKVSHIQLPKEKGCRLVDPANNEWDCWSHAVLYETETANLKPLKVVTDTWCSSGGLTVDGGLAGTGGYKTGAKVVRYLDPCETCDWREYPNALADERWYGTQVTLGDGSFIVVGGRAAYSWEYIPREGMNNAAAFTFPFLRDTTDYMYGKGEGGKDFLLENNLYPFVYLVPDGNVYIFANNRSVLLNPNSNRIEREYPVLEGGKRTYPGTASSVLLPLKLSAANPDAVDAEVLICGGAVYDAYFIGNVIRKDFPPALQDCARMVITSSAPIWKREMMPTRRVMGDAVNLPTGDVLFINGAKVGSAGWHCNDDPNRVPLLYKPNAPEGQRFTELLPATIDRMYHSVAVLLPDGRILIGGSNDNDGYHYNVKFPTELRVEKFSPPYLDPAMAWRRPEILVETSDKFCPYGRWFSLNVRSAEYLDKDDQLQVTMYAPPFVTHSISMNQRLLVLDVFEVKNEVTPGVYKIVAVAPPSGNVAPPGYYLLTVVHNGIPSPSIWFQVK